MTPDYVMLKCPDGKNIVTGYNNLLSLSEFIECFNIKVEALKANEAENAVGLEEIASIFCDSNYVKNATERFGADVAVLEKNATKDKSSRKKSKNGLLIKKKFLFLKYVKCFQV